jgi:catechol 2,3-dioxygenase-like lactoylglutathione lyase family enzyme
MKIQGLHHAHISIPKGQENAARDFYCKFLGLPEMKKPAALEPRGGLWIQLPDRQLHIGTEDNVDRLATKAHLAYQVDDLAGWRKKLTDHGIKTLDSIVIEGYDRFEFRDPFGNRVEFIRPSR